MKTRDYSNQRGPVMKRTISSMAAVAALATMFLAGPASANPILNGSFETNDGTGGWTGATWTVTRGHDDRRKHPGGGERTGPDRRQYRRSYVAEQGNYFAMLGDNKGTGGQAERGVQRHGRRIAADLLPRERRLWQQQLRGAVERRCDRRQCRDHVTSTNYVEYQFWVHATGHDTLSFTALTTDGFLPPRQYFTRRPGAGVHGASGSRPDRCGRGLSPPAVKPQRPEDISARYP